MMRSRRTKLDHSVIDLRVLGEWPLRSAVTEGPMAVLEWPVYSSITPNVRALNCFGGNRLGACA